MNHEDIVESKNNHAYMINRNFKQIMLIHPGLKKTIESEQKIGHNLLNENDEYHVKYYHFLKQHGFFTKKEKSMYFDNLKPGDVKEYFFNVGNVLLEVTENCNLNCLYCCYGNLYSHQKHREKRSHNLARAIALLSYIFENRDSSPARRRNRNMVLSFYGGEPLLDMNFVKEIVNYSKKLAGKYDGQFRYSLTTNGILLDKYMQFFVDHDFQMLISLDGDAEASSYRVFSDHSPAFPRVYENSKLLKKTHPDYFKKNVNFSVVLHNRNSYYGVLDYFNREFNVKPLISKISEKYLNREQLDSFREISQISPGGQREFKTPNGIDKDHYLYKNVKELIKHLSNNYYSEISRLLPGHTSDSHSIRTGACYPFQLKVYLTVSGDIYTCERLSEAFILGNVSEKGVCIDDEKIVTLYKEYFNRVFALCGTCHNFQTCRKCAFLIHTDQSGVKCDDYLSLKAFRSKTVQTINLLEDNPELLTMILKENQHDSKSK